MQFYHDYHSEIINTKSDDDLSSASATTLITGNVLHSKYRNSAKPTIRINGTKSHVNTNNLTNQRIRHKTDSFNCENNLLTSTTQASL